MKVTERSNEELQEMLANATKTGVCCGGHGKAARNYASAEAFKKELEARNQEIPEKSALLEKGIFNGHGSQ